MYARPGDWLVVEQATIDREARRGRIKEVRSPEGMPPYLVQWLDTGHEALVFPGPDAHVATQEELNAVAARASARAENVQREIFERPG